MVVGATAVIIVVFGVVVVMVEVGICREKDEVVETLWVKVLLLVLLFVVVAVVCTIFRYGDSITPPPPSSATTLDARTTSTPTA